MREEEITTRPEVVVTEVAPVSGKPTPDALEAARLLYVGSQGALRDAQAAARAALDHYSDLMTRSNCS